MNYGIDYTIDNIVTALESLITWNDMYLYGRLYRNLLESVYVPEIYLDNGEYKQVFIDDTKGGECGFYVIGRSYEGFVYRANVEVIFTINRDKIRINDERLMLYAEKYLMKTGYVNNITDVKTGIDNVFADFNTEGIKNRDMYPWHVFSLTIEINYKNNAC